MKKRWLCLIIAAVILMTACVGTTFAWLISSSGTVENTFTAGNVKLTLTETTGSQYPMIPGASLDKDPKLTVLAKSESCWLFVKVEPSAEFKLYCSYAMADGWIPLTGETGVYYRSVTKSNSNSVFPVLKDDHITVHDTVTESVLASLPQLPTLALTGYAIQRSGISTPAEAWRLVSGQEGGAGS